MAATAKMTSIRWQEWDRTAFRTAEEEGKPVLLAITATWCHWCHVMDQTSYSDPGVIGLVNSGFIPVRVDADQRPDIARRYNQGGLPSVAILDSRGELIAGCIYTPPREMSQFLEQVADLPVAPVANADATDGRPFGHPAAAPQGDGQPSNVDRVIQRLGELYDPDYGGFGREPKQPPWDALGLLLARHNRTGDKGLLGMVTTTLDAMFAGLYDHMDHGFFRYSVARDWKVPHYEKMLVSNAGLAGVYLDAYQVTKKRLYRKAATGALDYILTTLYDHAHGLFYASQDAGEEYYRLPWQDRAPAVKPSIDHTFYTGWNASVAGSLIKAFGVLGGRQYLGPATRILETIWSEAWSEGHGLCHVLRSEGKQPRYLADHVQTALALIDLHQVAGDPEALDRAVRIIHCTQELFAAPEGGFYDVYEGQPAVDAPLRPDRPVTENSLLAEAMMRVSCLTGNAEYENMARDILEVFRGAAPGSSYLGPAGSRRMEEDEERLFLPAGSAWGRAWDLVENGPVHMVLVGEPSDRETGRLLKSALRTYAPHKLVQVLDPGRDRERISALGFPAGGGPALYVCMGRMCLAPITTSEEVRRLSSSRPWASPAISSRSPTWK